MKSDTIFLRHILENIAKIEPSFSGVSLPDFESDSELVDATLRRLEVIGEAVKNISEQTRSRYPSVEWRKISATRDKLIHFYFGVDTRLIYNIVSNDLPVLKKQVLEILRESEGAAGAEPQ